MSGLVASELQHLDQHLMMVERVAMFDQCFCKSFPNILQAVRLHLRSPSLIQSKHNHLSCHWPRIFACFSITTEADPTAPKACVRVENMVEEAHIDSWQSPCIVSYAPT